MDVKQLRKEAEKLPNIEKLASEFEKAWLKPIRAGAKNGYSFLESMPEESRKEANARLRTLKSAVKDVRYGQIVNEKLLASAHNLVELKIASLTNDKKKVSRLLDTFIKDPQMRIAQLIVEVPYLESQLLMLHQSYNSMLESLSGQLPLEHRVPLLDGQHRQAMSKLVSVSKKQKECLSKIGRQFVDITREIKSQK